MKKRKIRSTMSVFLTTFLLLQIIVLFLYKSFIVDISKKNEKNLVENTLQIYHNTMESVLERLDDNLDLLLGCRLLLTQLTSYDSLLLWLMKPLIGSPRLKYAIFLITYPPCLLPVLC